MNFKLCLILPFVLFFTFTGIMSEAILECFENLAKKWEE